MRKHSVIALLLFVGGCATYNNVTQKGAPGWVTVTDDAGFPAASVNERTGEVKYFADPDKAFRALFQAHAQFAAQVQQERAAGQAKPVPKDAKKEAPPDPKTKPAPKEAKKEEKK